ncbi:MAG TPA: TetR/AcrR family transcriptional regulator [Candidatus Binatia bacterium]|nr:TetR/AcrR family transcriptional regulator [Candidatus Binatia bacterium]
MAVNAPAARNRARGAGRALAAGELRLEALRRRREREHRDLVRAALRVFLRRGYAETRVDDILREAGISTRAFYRFHASKDELFLDLFDRANLAAMARLRARVARKPHARAQLDAYVDATLELAYDPRLERQTRLFASVPAELTARHAEDVRACREQLVAVLREIVARGAATGEFPAADPELDAWALHGALGAALELALRPRERPPRAGLARRLRRFCRAALGAAPR